MATEFVGHRTARADLRNEGAEIAFFENRLRHLLEGGNVSAATDALAAMLETSMNVRRALEWVDGKSVVKDTLYYDKLLRAVPKTHPDESPEDNQSEVHNYVYRLIKVVRDAVTSDLTGGTVASYNNLDGANTAVRLDNPDSPVYIYLGQDSDVNLDFARLLKNSPRSIDDLQITGNEKALTALNEFLSRLADTEHGYEIDSLRIYHVDLPTDFIQNLCKSGVKVRHLVLCTALNNEDVEALLTLKLTTLGLFQFVSDEMFEQLLSDRSIKELILKITPKQANEGRNNSDVSPKKLIVGDKENIFNRQLAMEGIGYVDIVRSW